MRSLLSITSWILLFLLAPFTVLILLSQNSVPGDLFYPVKRGLEGVVLAAAAASPATRVAFRTDLTERRFKEAQKLLLAKADTTALDNFITEVQSTQTEIDALSNVLEKQQSSEKLIAKIDDYQVKLTQLQAQTQSSSQTNQPQTVQQQVLPPSGAGQQAPSISGGGQAGQSAPLLQPTSPPQQPTVVVQNPPAQIAVASPEQQRVVSETIVTTKIELERIKKDLEEKKKEREEKKEEKREEQEKRSERSGRSRQED